MMLTSFNPPNMARLQRLAGIVGIGGFVLLLVGLFINHDQFFHSYLIGFTLWTGIAVGSIALLMLQHLTGGGWGFVIRRILEAATRTLPLMALLFIPILLGSHSIYPWTHADIIQHHPVVAKKLAYLNVPFFAIRAVVYFAAWMTLMYLLNRWSLIQDRTGDNKSTKNMRLMSGPGMILLIFTVTFASTDWYMSLEPEWFSTIYGFLFVAAWSLSALAFAIAILANLAKTEPMKNIVAPLHFHDLGKLLLALVMLWSYFAFSQFLIIWSGNLPEEIGWYLKRIHGPWGVIAITLVALHFAAPFLFLLSRSVKRNPKKLVIIACLVLVMRYIDLLWMLVPSFTGVRRFSLSWMDIVGPIAFGGIWLAYFFWQLSKRSLIPINDPQYESVLEQMHEGHGH